jgi:hypothetical protein
LLEDIQSEIILPFGHTCAIHEKSPKRGCANGDFPPSTRDSRDGEEKSKTLIPAYIWQKDIPSRESIREYFRDKLGRKSIDRSSSDGLVEGLILDLSSCSRSGIETHGQVMSVYVRNARIYEP